MKPLQEHFNKLAISFTEQTSKEKFLRAIDEDIPINITLDSNQKLGIKYSFELFGVLGLECERCQRESDYLLLPFSISLLLIESKAANLRRKLEEREQTVSQIQTEIGEVAEVACRGKEDGGLLLK